jgi:hypothetical protein
MSALAIRHGSLELFNSVDEARRRKLGRSRIAATELMDEIVATSERVRAARTFGGQQPKRVDATFRLLRAIERTSYCLSIADAGRALRMSRQGAHKTVIRAIERARRAALIAVIGDLQLHSLGGRAAPRRGG